MNQIRLRSVNGRIFYDPGPVLVKLREVETDVARSQTPDLIKRLRTGRLKTSREARAAAIFAYGVGQALGGVVRVSPGEFEDGDFLLQIQAGDLESLVCVQYKELPPADLNPDLSLDELIAGVQHRPESDAVLAIHLNREGKFDLATLQSFRVPYRELWYFWAGRPDSEKWQLFGDVMGDARLTEFHYPSAADVEANAS